MKELTKHIEALLLDNDCVILPNFGGFITNRASARWVEEEHMFLPPYRTVGFNPQLKINDGLLVQSYMQTHDATFPEALKLVEKAIEKLSEFLYKEGVVELRGIGRLYRTYAGEFHFEPTEDGVLTPTLYGLSSVATMPVEILAAQRKEEEKREKKETETVTVTTPATTTATDGEHHHTIIIKLKRAWVANIAATAAAVVLFFLLSTPVDNTYIEKENYASLGSVSVFEQVKGESLLTTLFEIPAEKPLKAKAKKESKPTAKAPKAEPKMAEVQQPAVADTPKPIVAETPKAEAKPVEVNTTVEKTSKAATATEAPKAEAKPTEAPKAETKPAEAKLAEVAPKAEIKPVGPKFNIIVASVASESDADVAIKDFAEKGHAGAFLIKGGGRFRIALKAFDNEAEAYRVANELKKDELFKHAWVLKTKK